MILLRLLSKLVESCMNLFAKSWGNSSCSWLAKKVRSILYNLAKFSPPLSSQFELPDHSSPFIDYRVWSPKWVLWHPKRFFYAAFFVKGALIEVRIYCICFWCGWICDSGCCTCYSYQNITRRFSIISGITPRPQLEIEFLWIWLIECQRRFIALGRPTFCALWVTAH